MSFPDPNSSAPAPHDHTDSYVFPGADGAGATGDATGGGSDTEQVQQQMRDIAEVPAVEVITTAAVHLMSAAAVKCGLADGPDAAELTDLDEARKLITALAGFVTAAAPEIGSQHAGPLRDGLRSLQLAFREASAIPDKPGQGPGEKYTGPVN
ncbi:DUF1844 domain-containing protein [Tersicoccus sp. Bi-70]|uniref:DUF1844 domain-containing protein n=1 Tax=Tersicoccus sp. Bi-70 TaxID=1897634 RepID=UPI0018E95004